MYFVNTGDGFETYETEQEAKNAAQRAIDDWRDCCDPEWPDEVADVCWGKILGYTSEVATIGGDVDFEVIDYVLTSKDKGEDTRYRVVYDSSGVCFGVLRCSNNDVSWCSCLEVAHNLCESLVSGNTPQRELLWQSEQESGRVAFTLWVEDKG